MFNLEKLFSNKDQSIDSMRKMLGDSTNAN